MDTENTLYLDLEAGRVTIELYADVAPKHVARIKELTRAGFYDGLTFHRVIDGFMAQGGDPDGTGMGGSGHKIEAEFSDKPHMRGACSMARSQDINSGDSQFFICFGDASFLDGQYSVWGQVADGMDFVDGLKRGEGMDFSMNGEPDKIVKMQVAADAG